jgi:hypothetical protein
MEFSDDNVSIRGRFEGFVLDNPVESSEEGAQEINADLGFGIALLEIMVIVLPELPD